MDFLVPDGLDLDGSDAFGLSRGGADLYMGAKLLWLAFIGNFTVYLCNVNVMHLGVRWHV